MINVIPDYSEKYFDFEKKFGRLFYLSPDCVQLCYESKTEKKTYKITGEVTKGELEELYKKSLKENKDYILRYAKKNGKLIDIGKDIDEDLTVVY